MNNRLKIQITGARIPLKERREDLFYFEMRDSDIDNGYTIEKGVLVNHIGSVIANKDILQGKEFITDEEFAELDYDEVYDLYTAKQEMENDLDEMEVE